MPDTTCGVYSIVSPSGNMYIGSSKRIKDRWVNHRSYLRNQKHHSQALQRASNKYGAENLTFHILLFCRLEDLQLYEQQYLDFYKPVYNCSPKAWGLEGHKVTEEIKRKISIGMKGKQNSLGRTLSAEHKKKIGDAQRGRKRSVEVCQNISNGLKGKSHLTGKHMSEETKLKQRLQKLGIKKSDETRLKMSEAKKLYWKNKREALGGIS